MRIGGRTVKRKTGVALIALVAALIALGVVLVRQGGSSSSSAQSAGYVQPGWHGAPQNEIRPPEELWSGTATLSPDRPYGLDEKPPGGSVEQCGGCVELEEPSHGQIALHAINGILRWPKAKSPSYYDCLRLREGGTEDAVLLQSPTHGGLPPGAWMCATVRKDAIARLRYEGKDGAGYRFDVTTWKRPWAE